MKNGFPKYSEHKCNSRGGSIMVKVHFLDWKTNSEGILEENGYNTTTAFPPVMHNCGNIMII